MAEEDDKNTEAEAGGSKTKMIILIVVVVLLAAGASVGVTLFLLGGDEKPAEAEAGAEAASEPAHEPASYLPFNPPFIIDYDVGGKQRFMQISISAMARDKAAIDAIKLHMPLVRNNLVNLFASVPFEELNTYEGKVAMQQKALESINGLLEQEGETVRLEQVLFTNMVLQ